MRKRNGAPAPCRMSCRSPAGECRGPWRRRGRRRRRASDGSTGPSDSEGGTDRPCRRRGGTRLGSPAAGQEDELPSRRRRYRPSGGTRVCGRCTGPARRPAWVGTLRRPGQLSASRRRHRGDRLGHADGRLLGRQPEGTASRRAWPRHSSPVSCDLSRWRQDPAPATIPGRPVRMWLLAGHTLRLLKPYGTFAAVGGSRTCARRSRCPASLTQQALAARRAGVGAAWRRCWAPPSAIGLLLLARTDAGACRRRSSHPARSGAAGR
jgi:hypothetical protein